MTLTSGTSDVATSQVSPVAGPTVAADGTVAGQLVWTVTGAGTTTSGSSLLTNPPATAADVAFGGSQSNVGFIGVPGGLTVDPSVPVTNRTASTGSATSCAAIPPSNVLWLSPHDLGATTYASYTSSTTAAGSCSASFRAVSLGGEVDGLYVQAPVTTATSS